jgi:hypothetical protein
MDGGHTPAPGPTSEEEATSELIANFAQTVGVLFSAGSVLDTLVQVASLAVSTIEGCDHAGIFLLEGSTLVTPAASDALVTQIDALQRSSREGPCAAAISQGVAFYSGDLTDDQQWPTFGPQAAALGVRSIFALPLPIDGSPGALNLYARYPNAFGVIDRGRGQLLATMAGMAITSARAQEDEERRAANLHAALATRELIGQAQGILMEREHIDGPAAFDVLRRASQHLNVKLRDVAQSLIDTGVRPETGTR